MKNNRNGFGIIPIIVALLVIIIVASAGFVVYQSKHKAQEVDSAKSYNPSALMTVTSSDGRLCNGSCNLPVHNLYKNGKFEGYKELSSSEVSQLKNIIDATDFTKYGPNPKPHCESFVDGSDLVLLFPQKYGNKTFTTCMLDIPKNDNAFSYINKLLESHYIQQD